MFTYLGTTLIRNFESKLRRILEKDFPSIHFIKPNDPINSSYSGAVKLANSSNMSDLWIQFNEYDEFGSALWARKLL